MSSSGSENLIDSYNINRGDVRGSQPRREAGQMVDAVTSQIGRFHVLKIIMLMTSTLIFMSGYTYYTYQKCASYQYMEGVVQSAVTDPESGMVDYVLSSNNTFTFKYKGGMGDFNARDVATFYTTRTGDVITVDTYESLKSRRNTMLITMFIAAVILRMYWKYRNSEMLHRLGAFIQFVDATT